VEPHVCPDFWTKLKYDSAEGRVHCQYPAEVSRVGNPKCLLVAKFPENYDRRGWARHCGVEWQGVTYSKTAYPTAGESPVVPNWALAKNACPDGWTRLQFNQEDLQLYCQAPADASTERGINCAGIVKFTQSFDRCRWASFCDLQWTGLGCSDSFTTAIGGKLKKFLARVVENGAAQKAAKDLEAVESATQQFLGGAAAEHTQIDLASPRFQQVSHDDAEAEVMTETDL